MKKFLFVVVAAAILAAVVMVPAPAGAECATCIAFGGGYGYGGYQSSTGQIHEWLDLAERGTAMVPKAVAAIVLTEKLWESRSPRPPVQTAVYYPPPPPPAPPVPAATGRLVVIGSVAPGELFLDGESKGSLGSLEVKSFDLPTGQHSVIMKTPKKVLTKTVGVSPSSVSVVNFDP